MVFACLSAFFVFIFTEEYVRILSFNDHSQISLFTRLTLPIHLEVRNTTDLMQKYKDNILILYLKSSYIKSGEVDTASKQF